MRISPIEKARTVSAWHKILIDEQKACFVELNTRVAQVLQVAGAITSDDLNRFDREFPAGTLDPSKFDWSEVNEMLGNGLGSEAPTTQVLWLISHPDFRV